MTTIIGALVIGLIMSSPVALLPNVNAQTLSYRDHPLPPQVQGCYHYTNTTGWKNISCATEDELKQIRAHPPMEGNTYGIYGVTALNTKVTFGKVDVKFTQYSGESDSKKGTNTWSIQTNTNYFNGNNGQKDWVQFVYQNSPNSSYRNNFCTWQVVDVQPGPADFSNVHCVTSGLPPTQTLSSSYEAYTTGSYLSGSITGEFCINSGAQCWGVVTTDSYNLHSNWVDTSGTILGHSDLSVANFVSPTTETTTVTSTPETSMQEDPDTTTGEENNLSYTTHSWACNPTCTDTSTSHV